MKKALMAVGLFVAGLGSAQALSFGELKDDIVTQTKWSVLQQATPGYFYDAVNGVSLGGAITHISEYRFLTADAGWITDGNFNNSAVIGGSVHVDKLVRQIFPNFTDISSTFIPETIRPFWDKLAIGSFFSYNFSDDTFGAGLYSGLEFRF